MREVYLVEPPLPIPRVCGLASLILGNMTSWQSSSPPKQGKIMRKLFITITTLLFLSSNTFALAEPPVISDLDSRLVIELCTMTTETPHYSKHVRGTVNVTARTRCKGISAGRHLRITITLTREDGGNTPPVTKSISGSGSVMINVAMPCIWSSRQPEIEYKVRTVHKISNGKTGVTGNGAFLKC